MKPFEKISSQIDTELEQDLPKKWKKIGDIIILDLSKIDKEKRTKIAETYADILGAKTIIQKNYLLKIQKTLQF